MHYKNHHYLPACYIRGWINPDTSQVQCYIRKKGIPKPHTFRQIPENVGWEEHLYTKTETENFHLFAPNGITEIESEYLKKLDTDASHILRDLKVCPSNQTLHLDEHKRIIWARFIYALLIRHPKRVAQLKKLAPAVQEQLYIDKGDEVLSQFHPSTIKYYKHNLGLECIVYHTDPNHKHSPSETKDNIKALINLHWWIEDFSHVSMNVIGSDSGITFFSKIPGKPIMAKYIANSLIAVPISYNKVFFASYNDININLLCGGENFIKLLNKVTVTNACKLVIDFDNQQKRFIENNFSQGMKLDKKSRLVVGKITNS